MPRTRRASEKEGAARKRKRQKEEEAIENALSYLKQVKLTIGPLKYKSFLDILKRWERTRRKDSDTLDLMWRVKDFFGDNNDLILGFNKFLPERLRVDFPETATRDETRPRKRVKKSAESAVTVQAPPSVAQGKKIVSQNKPDSKTERTERPVKPSFYSSLYSMYEVLD